MKNPILPIKTYGHASIFIDSLKTMLVFGGTLNKTYGIDTVSLDIFDHGMKWSSGRKVQSVNANPVFFNGEVYAFDGNTRLWSYDMKM